MTEAKPPRAPSAARDAKAMMLGGGAFQAMLALIAAGGVALLALMASRAAEPLGFTLLAVLASVGVFFLFGLAAQHIRFFEATSATDLLRAMVEAIDVGAQITDEAGRVLHANRAFRELAGTNDLGEANTLESVFAGEAGGAEALFRLSRAMERGQTHSENISVGQQGSRQGHARCYRLAVKPVEVPGAATEWGRLTLWQLADITQERAREAEALAAVESRLSHYDELPIGILVADGDGRIGYVNDRLIDWLGLTPDACARGLTLADLVSDDGAALLASLAGQRNGGHHRIDLDLICDDGRRWPATLLAAPRSGILTLAVLERADEERQARTARSAEVRFSRFFQSAPFGIAMVDKRGRIVSANAAFARLLLDGAAQRGGDAIELLARGRPETRASVEAALAAALEGKANIPPFCIEVEAKDREFTRQVYMTSLVRPGAAGEAAILYLIDVTDQKALELKVAQGQKMEAVGTLAGGIAHDFNNVLTAIIGFSDLLLQTHKPGDPAYKNIVSIKSSANRAAGLVSQLLAFSRRQTLQPKVLQLGDVLTDLSVLLNRLLGEKIDLKIVSGRDLWFVKADRTQLEQVMINLSVNARDAMLPNGGRLTIRTRNVAERESQKLEGQGMARGEYVLIEVEDTGTGMTPEVMAKVFEPFFTTKTIGKGTGLGLATVYGIVKQTGGYILPASVPGEGTTFRVYLPRHLADSEEEVATTTSKKKERPRDLTGTGRVLLVEDEDAVRRFAVEALKSKGYDVLQASDGIEALDVMKANGNRVDIVVSDVIMPEMDGPTLLKELRKTNPKLKFIFVSGYPDDAFKNNLDPNSEYAFLPKPYSLAQIAAVVKEQLAR
jgi:two-component system cell cycle sensor histidine kinase/response regulator CckA